MDRVDRGRRARPCLAWRRLRFRQGARAHARPCERACPAPAEPPPPPPTSLSADHCPGVAGGCSGPAAHCRLKPPAPPPAPPDEGPPGRPARAQVFRTRPEVMAELRDVAEARAAEIEAQARAAALGLEPTPGDGDDQ